MHIHIHHTVYIHTYTYIYIYITAWFVTLYIYSFYIVTGIVNLRCATKALLNKFSHFIGSLPTKALLRALQSAKFARETKDSFMLRHELMCARCAVAELCARTLFCVHVKLLHVCMIPLWMFYLFEINVYPPWFPIFRLSAKLRYNRLEEGELIQ